MRFSIAAVALVAISLAVFANDAFAQYGTPSSASSLRYLNPASNAAQNILNRPTVSPYLNLLGSNGLATGPARYQTLVRPQLEARQTEMRNTARFSSLQQDIQRVSTAVGGIGMQQSQQQYPFVTGHPSVYLNGSHFYPGLGR
jgi:hypothetical protein